LWTNRIVAFGLTFTVGVLLLVGVVLTLAGPTIENLLSRVAPVHSLWIRAWPYIQWSISATFIFIAIELLYVIAPNVPRRGRVTVPGALVAASIWLLLSWGLEYYFHQVAGAKLDRFYGALASPIALMGWVYWSASAILIGAEINVHLQAQKNRREKVLQFESDAA
jgi:membrane protein